ncbi:Putative virion core protein (Lumpy skin disease virus) [Thermococcus nautili]|uniref:SPFH domain-containing protein n=1 Tax=Thermococcus nautili TaxID=195522 RepID=UPI0025550661|nr:SPFH domain-containing protein [Thermococcus nautili]CAI1493902.1 Putative virion core protein (Lumpy skin disease virus) [Thermococcus nautili]
MVEVIEWVNPGEDEIIWRYPNEVIKWGAQLIVHEYEVAVFMRDGKIYDVLGPGRHTLTTQNLPLLYKLVGGSNSPFKATIIFVSMKQFQGRYGGETQTKELAPVKYYGVYWFKVADPVLFITEVVGGQSLYDASDVTKFIRAYFNEGMMKHLSAYSIVDLFQNLDMVSTQVKIKLMEDFRRLGLELVDVKIEGVNTTDEWRQRLFWLMQTGNAQAVMQMDTVKQVAAELGKSPGASVGTGMVLVPQLFQQPAQPAQPVQQAPAQPYAGAPPAPQQPQQTAPAQPAQQEICPYCGKPIPPGARFCPYCGKQIHRCPNGHIVPEGAKFCPVCGAKIE